ncbi:beta-class carbonic anhydrase [Anaerobacillus isosaccharinicus]|uniref:carbonic anhydrase n=1 Tax=Anaerobacillus isosaccharinicus TaxID=1532552 RepID=A0A1S2KTL4_9BACI|nr:carbonic anhydrase [Anaerobacillus isosaccharinicus]MBA5588085.1 carbonic anhydrase [Anaerobacillus isosaccharinicus]QOY33776.1 carbonic anhydrase [Anaerobacillus isosaccharinicus]
MSSLLEDILNYNQAFVSEKLYEPFMTTQFPNKKLVILTCMDTRLKQLLPRAINLQKGDAIIIKNAGAVISHPFGSIMRSIIVAIYELGAQEVLVIGHHNCGMAKLEANSVLDKAKLRGIDQDTLEVLRYSGVNIDAWLKGFTEVEDSVKHSVDIVKNHPLLPSNIPIHGLIIDPKTGKLDTVINGYQEILA